MKFELTTELNTITADKLRTGELAQIVEPRSYAGQTVMRYGDSEDAQGIVSLDNPRHYWDSPQYITVRPLAAGYSCNSYSRINRRPENGYDFELSARLARY